MALQMLSSPHPPKKKQQHMLWKKKEFGYIFKGIA